MKLRLYSLLIAVIAVLLIGCGGSGTSGTTTRVLAGFVYAKGNTLGSGPNVVVTTSANPPTGYFAPTSGTVTLSVAEGTLTRSPDSEVFNMAVSNAIVVTAKAPVNSVVNVSGSNIILDSVLKSLTPYSVNLGDVTLSGTVKLMPSTDAPLYTPGPAVSLQYTVDGAVPTDPKELFIAGAPAGSGGDRILSMIGLDSNGVIDPNATFTVTSTTNGVVPSGTGSSITLQPGSAANSSVEGDTTVSIALTGQNIAGSFLANFSYGTVTAVTVTPGSAQLLWNTAGVGATTSISALVKNQFNAPMFGQTVDLTNPGKTAANTWITQAGATAFTAASGPTDTTGAFTTTLTAPVSAVAGGGLNLTPKGANTITATVGVIVGTANVKVVRPLDSVTIAGPTRVDIGTTTPSTGSSAYRPTSAVDVDGALAPLADYPALTLTYTVTNSVAGPAVGNTGDLSTPTTSTSAIMAGLGNENRVVAGNNAGLYAVQVTGGVPNPSNIVATDVYGNPTKVLLSPQTNTVNAIPGALGNYSGATSSTVAATFTLIDSAGHTIPSGELDFNTIFILQPSTGGSITSGGSNVSSFDLTFGPTDGLLDIDVIQGVWASSGGNRTFNISRVIGHDSN